MAKKKGPSSKNSPFSIQSFPLEFQFVLLTDPEVDKSPSSTHKPFTEKWKSFWEGMSGLTGRISEKGKFIGEQFELNPKAGDRFSHFREKSGFDHLESLARKGANPNFILRLFVSYLWNDRITLTEQKDPHFLNLVNSYDALVRTKHVYMNSVDDKLLKRSREFESVLCKLGNNFRDVLQTKDLSKARRSPPRDKENRVIFTIYKHLKQTTGQPNWRPFLDLLLSAGAISKGQKRKRVEDIVTDNPDRRIMTRIRSFKRAHPQESQVIEHFNFLTHRPPR